MKKLSTKEQAQLFAAGFEKGRASTKRLSRRASILAKWRSYAIERLGLGPELVREIDLEARKRSR